MWSSACPNWPACHPGASAGPASGVIFTQAACSAARLRQERRLGAISHWHMAAIVTVTCALTWKTALGRLGRCH